MNAYRSTSTTTNTFLRVTSRRRQRIKRENGFSQKRSFSNVRENSWIRKFSSLSAASARGEAIPSRAMTLGIAAGFGYGLTFGYVLQEQEILSSKLSSAIAAQDISSVEGLHYEHEHEFSIRAASKVIPHFEKVAWGGEDAVYTGENVFGIFDGVSGAAKFEGYPLYSTTLARRFSVLDNESDIQSIKDLVEALVQAKYYADEFATGASTALVVSISKDRILRAVNVGDSGLIVIRNNKIVSRTLPKSHELDMPYQLSQDCTDHPRDGTTLEFELKTGDIIVMASDGVFDNVHDRQILSLTRGVSEGETDVNSLAEKIAVLANNVSYDINADTPYSRAVQNEYDNLKKEGRSLSSMGFPATSSPLVFKGGKLDDISCIALVCS